MCVVFLFAVLNSELVHFGLMLLCTKEAETRLIHLLNGVFIGLSQPNFVNVNYSAIN